MATFDLSLADVRSRVANAIGLDNTASSLEQGLIDSWTNEGCLDFLERTKAKVEQASISLTAGEGDYELPGTILVVNDISVTNASDGQVLPLEPIPIEEMMWRRRYPGATPVRYYALQGANLLSLYPTPDSPDTMNLYFVPFPATLSGATDLLSAAGVPPQFQYIVELYVKAKAGEYNDHSSSQNGMVYMQQYMTEVRKARGRIRREQGRRRPPALPGRRDRRKYYPAYPGQDTGF